MNEADRYLFCLPLPLSFLGPNARLAGLWYCLTDNRLSCTGESVLLRCRMQKHSLPSPGFVFSQGINPQTLLEGPYEDAFYRNVEEQFSTGNTVVLTWSSHYLQSFDSCALRLFKNPNMLSKPVCVLDIRVLLQVCALFGSAGGNVGSSLVTTAFNYGYKEKIKRGDHKLRLRALRFLFSWAVENNPAVVNFMLRPLAQKAEFISDTLSHGKYLVTLTFDGTPCIIKPLHFERNLLTGLVLNIRSSEVKRTVFNICAGNLLCTTNILTPLRQRNLGINLRLLCERLEKVEMHEIEQDSDYFTTMYYASLSDIEKQVYVELMRGNFQALREKSSKVSQKFYNTSLINYGDINQRMLTGDELSLYRQICFKRVEKSLQRYADEVERLYSKVDENNPDELTLLQQIASYPQIL